MRSSATVLAIMRAPFRQDDDPLGGRRGAASAGAVNAVTDDTDHRGNRKKRGDARYDHQPAHAGHHAGRDGVGPAAGAAVW